MHNGGGRNQHDLATCAQADEKKSSHDQDNGNRIHRSNYDLRAAILIARDKNQFYLLTQHLPKDRHGPWMQPWPRQTSQQHC